MATYWSHVEAAVIDIAIHHITDMNNNGPQQTEPGKVARTSAWNNHNNYLLKIIVFYRCILDAIVILTIQVILKTPTYLLYSNNFP